MFQRWINSQVSGLPADFIVAPVVFPASQWLGVKECSVPVFQEISDLKRLLERDAYLTSEQVSQIGKAIQNFEGITQKATVTPKPILKKHSR
jgi:hypothetical protein